MHPLFKHFLSHFKVQIYAECFITIHKYTHWCAIEAVNTTTYEKTSMCDCLNNRRKFEKNDDDKKIEE